MAAEKFFNENTRLVAATEPDDFWRRAKERGHVGKISILSDKDKTIRLGELPYGGVIRLIQTQTPDLIRAGKKIRELAGQFEAQVLVEQELHAAVSTRRSRSAA